MRHPLIGTALGILAGLTAISDGAKADPVVVELFTSQGCSSCPPADANLIKLSTRPDVLALSFGVTYWDYLGWEDTFARPEFTERQMVYEHPLGHAGEPVRAPVLVHKLDDFALGRRLGGRRGFGAGLFGRAARRTSGQDEQ